MNIARITDTITQFDQDFIDLYDTPAYASLTDDELAENETFQAELAALNDQRNDAMITTFGLHGDLENPDPTTAEHWKWKYQRFLFKEKLLPSNAHTFVIVTGEIYNIHWRYGLDWNDLKVEPDIHVEENDLTTIIVNNSTKVREEVQVTYVGLECSTPVDPLFEFDSAEFKSSFDWTNPESPIKKLSHGQNYFDPVGERLIAVFNGNFANQAGCEAGKGATGMLWKAIECVSLEKCFPGLQKADEETFLRYWTNKNHWEVIPEASVGGGGDRRRLQASIKDIYLDLKWKELPNPGDRVEILEGRNVIYDFHEGV